VITLLPAYVNVTKLTMKNCAQRFVLLKLTTDRHEASRGLFATAELLVFKCQGASHGPPATAELLDQFDLAAVNDDKLR